MNPISFLEARDNLTGLVESRVLRRHFLRYLWRDGDQRHWLEEEDLFGLRVLFAEQDPYPEPSDDSEWMDTYAWELDNGGDTLGREDDHSEWRWNEEPLEFEDLEFGFDCFDFQDDSDVIGRRDFSARGL